MKIRRVSLLIKALPLWLSLGWAPLWAQISVTVNAGTTVVTIPNALYGNNMQYYVGSNNGSDSTYSTALQVSGCRNIRWPGGSEADIVDWNNLVCEDTGAATTPQYITFLQQFGGTMQPIVNFSGYWCSGGSGSGTSTQFTHAQAVSLAETWVTWNTTNTGSAKAKYWEVGNESYGNWEQGGQGAAGSTLTGTVYGNYFADYYNGMKGIDSTINVGAVASPGSADYSNWTPNMLSAAKAAGVVPDFLIIHNYPVSANAPSGQATDSYILSFPSTVAAQTTSLNSIVSSALGSTYVGKVKYFMTEFNCCLGPDSQTNEYVNAMFTAEWLLNTAQSGWIGANLWATKNGGTPDYGFVNTSSDAPFPNYYVYPMLTSKFGQNMVSCTSSKAATVSAFAGLDASGDLTLFAVNNNPTASQSVTFNISGFTPASSGNAWVMLPQGTAPSGAPQEAPGLQINGTANPAPSAISGIAGTSQATAASFTVTLQPSEMYLLVVPASTTSSPTSTFTPTPTSTRTSTPSNTPTSTFTKTNTPTFTPTNTATSTASATASSTQTSTSTSSWTPSNTPTGTATSTASATPTLTASRTATSTATASFTPTRTGTSTPTASNSPTPTFTPTASTTATPTPSPSQTPTVTSTVSNTSTATPTASRTATSSPTSTFTASATPTATLSGTSTATPSMTATATPTSSPTVTTSPTPTASRTGTASFTPSNTATATASMTATPSLTPTASPTSTNSPTLTATSSPTASRTSTPTPTSTNSFTFTATITQTDTPTLTPTGTVSPSMTPTLSATASSTSSPSPSSTRTPSSTSTSTATTTASNTVSSTMTQTLTATLTPTYTASATATPIGTATPTDSATSSPSSTPTASPSKTATATATDSMTPSPTASSTQTSTSTSSWTPSRTPTVTATSTASLTPSSSMTATNSPTPTFTVPPSFTATWTPSPTASSTATASATLTPLPSATFTWTPTPSAQAGKGVVLYPNPVAGSGVKVLPPAYAGTADVRIEVLTVTFRKVLDQTFPDVPAGTAVTVPLDDSWGHPLADGLYYVVVEVNGKKTIAELLILR